jgi:hypothetical protein
MGQELAQKLKTEVESADWSLLESHHKRGAIFVVDAKLGLVTAGVAIVRDQLDLVKIWLDSDEMFRPSEDQVKEWESEPHKEMATFLIVQPYVLIQLI